jgi:hypothetical protein
MEWEKIVEKIMDIILHLSPLTKRAREETMSLK